MRASIIVFSLLSGVGFALPAMRRPLARDPLFSELVDGAKSLLGVGDKPATPGSSKITPQDAVSKFIRSAQFSQAAYCSAGAVINWKCGPPCDGLPGVEVLTAGGDDGLIPGFFVAHDPDSKSIVVAHQGTNKENILSIANDAQIKQVPMNTTLFPNIPGGVLVHEGFAYTQWRTADEVLATVQDGLRSKGVNKVLVTGHSLGAAIAMMDALMLRKALDKNIDIQTVVFGLPRGGNQAFADILDSELGDSFAYITNQNDPVPTVPPRFLDYAHPSNEVHIVSVDATTSAPTEVLACPGQDSEECATGNNVLQSSVSDHKGPYFRSDINMAGSGCPL